MASAVLEKSENFKCLPRESAGSDVFCSKVGGVCSIRNYEQGTVGSLRITCPHRFAQENIVFNWIGEEMLKTRSPLVVKELKFLETQLKEKEVGRIDSVLVKPDAKPLEWCAVEFQAVYFSGKNMKIEFENIRQTAGTATEPIGRRHPDYRSSGPKRLMPQLQIKYNTLSPWGKKLAVVVDEDFFASIGRMNEERDISNAELAWFVVSLKENGGRAVITPKNVHLTKLDEAVKGLIGGRPVTLKQFEEKIARKLLEKHPRHAAKLGISK